MGAARSVVMATVLLTGLLATGTARSEEDLYGAMVWTTRSWGAAIDRSADEALSGALAACTQAVEELDPGSRKPFAHYYAPASDDRKRREDRNDCSGSIGTVGGIAAEHHDDVRRHNSLQHLLRRDGLRPDDVLIGPFHVAAKWAVLFSPGFTDAPALSVLTPFAGLRMKTASVEHAFRKLDPNNFHNEVFASGEYVSSPTRVRARCVAFGKVYCLRDQAISRDQGQMILGFGDTAEEAARRWKAVVGILEEMEAGKTTTELRHGCPIRIGETRAYTCIGENAGARARGS